MLILVILLYLSGLNMLEGILNKERLAKVPSKTLEAKLKIMGGDFIWILYGVLSLRPSLYFMKPLQATDLY